MVLAKARRPPKGFKKRRCTRSLPPPRRCERQCCTACRRRPGFDSSQPSRSRASSPSRPLARLAPRREPIIHIPEAVTSVRGAIRIATGALGRGCRCRSGRCRCRPPRRQARSRRRRPSPRRTPGPMPARRWQARRREDDRAERHAGVREAGVLGHEYREDREQHGEERAPGTASPAGRPGLGRSAATRRASTLPRSRRRCSAAR